MSASQLTCLGQTSQMPSVALNLVLAETRVYSGELLNATVLLDSTDPENCIHEFLAEIRGVGRTGWVNIRTDKIYETEQEYLNIVVPLCQRPMELAPGRHKFGIRIAIPESVPTSFESQFGSIRYQIRLQLIGNFDHCSAVEMFPFLVLAKSYLDDIPHAVMRHIEYEDEIDFTVCTLPFGTVHLTISLPRTGFCLGEVIRAHLAVRNGSRKSLKDCRLHLVLKSQFLATSRYEQANDRKLVETVLDSYPLGKIKGRTDMEDEECVLRVPEQTVPTLLSKGDAIVSLSYVLRFNALPGIETEIPIVITSLGYRTNVESRVDDHQRHRQQQQQRPAQTQRRQQEQVSPAHYQPPMPAADRRNGSLANGPAAGQQQKATNTSANKPSKRVSIIEMQNGERQFIC